MPTPSTDLANNLTAYIQRLEITRLKMEALLDTGDITRDDIEQVYSGLYLNVFTEFEGLIEELFFGLLSGNVVSPNCICIVPSANSSFARQILMLGKNYLDWLPYKHTLDRANIIFQNGEPFSLLQDQHKQNLQQYMYIRHVIAHKSEFSRIQFEQKVIGSRVLLPRERTPAGFLRSQFRGSPARIQYELIIQELGAMAQLLCQ